MVTKHKSYNIQQVLQKVKKEQEPKRIHIGKIIRKLRKDRGLAAIAVCRAAEDLDPRTLNALEMGRITNPSIKTLQSLARGLKINIADLFRIAEADQSLPAQSGTQKGFCEINFPKKDIRLIMYTPFVKNFICGKLIVGPKRRFDQTLFNHPHPFFVSVLVGRFEGAVESESFQLKTGDNLFFSGATLHHFKNPFARDSALYLVTAPSFL